jgi:hypothetical protein
MFLQKYARYALVLSLIALVGCAQQPLSSVAGKGKTVYLDPNIKVPDHYVYRDITGKRSRGVMSSFGLAGAIVGLMAGAASESPGYHRFDAAARKNPIDIKTLVRRDMEGALRTATFLKMSPTPNADTTLKIEVTGYGVGPVHERELGAVILAKATLMGRDGKEIWKKDEWSASDTTTTLENLEANPSLWPKMAKEASQALAKKMILYTSKTTRSNAEPFM